MYTPSQKARFEFFLVGRGAPLGRSDGLSTASHQMGIKMQRIFYLACLAAKHCLLVLVMPVNLSVAALASITNPIDLYISYTLHRMLIQARQRFIYEAAPHHGPCQIDKQGSTSGGSSSSSSMRMRMSIYALTAKFDFRIAIKDT